jgi:hypothetical protein
VLIEAYDADQGAASRFVNLSTLSKIGPESDRLIAGFYVTGSESKTLLIRAAGPSLAQFGLAESTLQPSPRLSVFRGNSVIATNEGWGGDPILVKAFARAGAFGYLSEASGDAALIVTLSPGPYTVHATAPSGAPRRGLIEIYELK